MATRVTSQLFARTAIHFNTIHGSALARAQRQISSGIRFELPSEQPIEYRQVRSLETRFTQLEADQSVLQLTTATLNASVDQLQDANNIVTLAKSLVQQGIQAFDLDERNALATEIDALLKQAETIGLAKFNGSFLFGGTRSDQPPFEFAPARYENGLSEVTYLGTKQRSQSHVGDSISIDTYYTGEEVFGATGRQSTVLVETTGLGLGTGTDNLNGRATVQVRHTGTSYSGGSGVQAGTGSVGNDTVLGPLGKHQIQINDTSGTGASGTVSLNNGPEVAFSSTDTNLEIVDAQGRIVYLDTTTIVPGFSGTVNLATTGTLSIDEGATTIPIGYSASQRVVDSATGRFVTLDTSNVNRTGDDSLEFPGTSNLFQVLQATADDLRNSRDLSNSEYGKALNRRLDELDRAASQVFDVLGQQASSLRTMQTIEERVEDLKLSVETRISDIQATDFPDAVVQLTNSQNLLQYTYAVTAQLTSLNLLQFLS
ncbi:MAG: flagellar hook-associated protein FlgL [Planctomycetota bacterium]